MLRQVLASCARAAATSIPGIGRVQPCSAASLSLSVQSILRCRAYQRHHQFASSMSAAPLLKQQGGVRAAAAEGDGAGAAAADSDAPAPESTMGYRLPLFLGYSALGAGLTFGTGIDPNVAVAMTSTLWLGFTLGMSLTEAWVKFRAPFLERHVAVDVGRHVFGALNSLEAAMATTMALQYWHYGPAALVASPAIPAALGALLGAQVLYLTPALSLRAQHLIASSADPAALSPRQQAALRGIQKVTQARPAPWAKLHAVYGVGELSKVALLGALVWQLVGGGGA